MSDQSESLGGAWRVLQTAIQFYFQFQMNRRLSGKQNKSEQRRLRQVQNQLYRARSNAAEELFSKQPFQFTGTENDIYYSTPMYDNNVSYPVTLRENQYFILCDYREGAKDSRYFGAVEMEEIKGKVITIIRKNEL